MLKSFSTVRGTGLVNCTLFGVSIQYTMLLQSIYIYLFMFSWLMVVLDLYLQLVEWMQHNANSTSIAEICDSVSHDSFSPVVKVSNKRRVNDIKRLVM